MKCIHVLTMFGSLLLASACAESTDDASAVFGDINDITGKDRTWTAGGGTWGLDQFGGNHSRNHANMTYTEFGYYVDSHWSDINHVLATQYKRVDSGKGCRVTIEVDWSAQMCRFDQPWCAAADAVEPMSFLIDIVDERGNVIPSLSGPAAERIRVDAARSDTWSRTLRCEDGLRFNVRVFDIHPGRSIHQRFASAPWLPTHDFTGQIRHGTWNSIMGSKWSWPVGSDMHVGVYNNGWVGVSRLSIRHSTEQ